MIQMIDAIVKDAFSEIEGLEFCVGVGSYGGGEIAQIGKSANNPKIYNDIDLLIIVDRKDVVDQIENARKKVSNNLGLDWVDLLIWNKKDLAKKRRTISSFDFYENHRVLIGGADSFKKLLIPFDGDEILKYDIKALFRTRAWAMLSLFASKDFFTDDRTFRNYQCAKAIFAIADFMALHSNSYQSSYAGKRNFVKSLSESPENEFIKRIIDSAYQVKLRPDSQSLNYIIDSDEALTQLGKLYVSSALDVIGRDIFSTILYFRLVKYITYARVAIRSLSSFDRAHLDNCHNRFQIEKKLLDLINSQTRDGSSKKFQQEIDLLIAQKV